MHFAVRVRLHMPKWNGNGISNEHTLDEHSIKGPETVEERLSKKRSLKECRPMETMDDRNTSWRVQEMDVTS